METKMINEIKYTADYIKDRIQSKPEIGIILGSGLGGLIDKIDIEKKFSYQELPNFPVSTVQGHSGNLIIGKLGNKPVVAMQGRFHYYEGYDMSIVTLPIRVMKLMGVSHLIVSNAAGGLNPDFKAGDIMFITDHINFFPVNPLRGPNLDKFGVRFPDMSNTYDKKMLNTALKIAQENDIHVQQGVYIGSSGPTLETPAEYRMFRILGADATGMSTVPEVIVAHHAGIKCFGVSVITNEAEPEDKEVETTHEEVQNVAGLTQPKLTKIITGLITSL